MRISTMIALAAMAVAPANALAAPPRTPLMPSGPWNVEFADSSCLLSRTFGASGPTLVLKPAMLSEDFEIVVTEPLTKKRAPAFGKAIVGVAGKTVREDAGFTAYDTANSRLLRLQVDEAEASLSSLQDVISIEAKGEPRRLFAIPGIKKALPVLAQCVDQLREAYKVGKSDLASVATRPVGKAARFFISADYPSDALRRGEHGTVGVLLWVETSGRISSCDVIEKAAAASLQQTTCSILQRRARFVPATAVDGTAVRAPIFVRIRWVIPD